MPTHLTAVHSLIARAGSPGTVALDPVSSRVTQVNVSNCTLSVQWFPDGTTALNLMTNGTVYVVPFPSADQRSSEAPSLHTGSKVDSHSLQSSRNVSIAVSVLSDTTCPVEVVSGALVTTYVKPAYGGWLQLNDAFDGADYYRSQFTFDDTTNTVIGVYDPVCEAFESVLDVTCTANTAVTDHLTYGCPLLITVPLYGAALVRVCLAVASVVESLCAVYDKFTPPAPGFSSPFCNAAQWLPVPYNPTLVQVFSTAYYNGQSYVSDTVPMDLSWQTALTQTITLRHTPDPCWPACRHPANCPSGTW